MELIDFQYNDMHATETSYVISEFNKTITEMTGASNVFNYTKLLVKGILSEPHGKFECWENKVNTSFLNNILDILDRRSLETFMGTFNSNRELEIQEKKCFSILIKEVKKDVFSITYRKLVNLHFSSDVMFYLNEDIAKSILLNKIKFLTSYLKP